MTNTNTNADINANINTESVEIHDVMFDYCKVLLEWNCRNCLQKQFPDLVDTICPNGTFGKDDLAGFYEFEDRMDGSELLKDLLPEYERRFGKDLSNAFQWYCAHYDQVLTRMMPGMVDLLHDLRKAGYGVWGLTNWSKETFPLALRKFPELNTLLQGTVISGVEKLHKPQPEIFELAMNRFGLKPQTTVFFDDKPVNIDGAHNVGMHGFVFTTAQQARKDLASLGVRL